MNTVARKLRFAASPVVLAVAMGFLAPNVLIDEEAEVAASPEDGAGPELLPAVPVEDDEQG